MARNPNADPAVRQRQALKARMSKPTLESLTEREKRDRRAALEIGRGLNLRIMKLIDGMVKRHERAGRKLEATRAAALTLDERKRLQAERMTNMDILALERDLQDRFGQPRRSQTQIELEAAAPLLVRIEGGLGWPEKEAADAAPRAARG